MQKSFLIGVVAVAAAAAQAQQQPSAGGAAMIASAPGTATVAAGIKVTAIVQAVDKANRLVTLKGPEGNVFDIQCGPEVKNFDQIKVGDEVAVRYLEALTLTLKKGGGAPREKVEAEDAAVAKPGQRPGVAAARKVTVMADVIAVDAAKQTIRLKGPKRTVDLPVKDPKQFAMVKVGDQVEATFVEAIALSVEPTKK
ncbi:MAG TPA: hypothetical protein VI032_09905 [Burkholderiaceae bacterium]